MVKSYQGSRIEVEVPKKSMQVADYMAKKLITFRPDQPMGEVIATLLKYKISGAPVINEANELIGVISEGDCLKQIIKGRYDNMPFMTGYVREHMATNVVTISPETNIFDAAKMFLDRRLRRFPVTHEGKLIGQISQKDIMRAVKGI